MEEKGSSFTQAQLVLAEKRTSLAVLRTAIVILALPMTVLTALITFSEHYNLRENILLVIPLGIFTLLLLVVAIFMIYRSIRNIIKYDRILQLISQENPDIERFMPRMGRRVEDSKFI